jgi:hypothetical protein
MPVSNFNQYSQFKHRVTSDMHIWLVATGHRGLEGIKQQTVREASITVISSILGTSFRGLTIVKSKNLYTDSRLQRCIEKQAE